MNCPEPHKIGQMECIFRPPASAGGHLACISDRAASAGGHLARLSGCPANAGGGLARISWPPLADGERPNRPGADGLGRRSGAEVATGVAVGEWFGFSLNR